jgi:hypothetical protein
MPAPKRIRNKLRPVAMHKQPDCIRKMSKAERDRKLEFYHTLQAAIIHASEDVGRSGSYNPRHRDRVEDFYDGDRSTDLLGYSMFRQFDALRRKVPDLKLVFHPLTALETANYIFQKADVYRNFAKQPVLTNGDDKSLFHGDSFVGKIDGLFRQFALNSSFPHLQEFLNLFREKSAIGYADRFSSAEIEAAKRHTAFDLPRVTHLMERHRPGHESDLRNHVDSGVISDAGFLNREQQVGLLTHSFHREAVGSNENWSALRSGYCLLTLMHALHKGLNDPKSSKSVALNVKDDLSLLFGRVAIIVDHLENHHPTSDDGRLPRPIREAMAEFEMEKFKQIMGLPIDREPETAGAPIEGGEKLRSQLDEAGATLEKTGHEILSLYPELLGDSVLTAYGVKDHPKVISLHRRLNP